MTLAENQVHPHLNAGIADPWRMIGIDIGPVSDQLARAGMDLQQCLVAFRQSGCPGPAALDEGGDIVAAEGLQVDLLLAFIKARVTEQSASLDGEGLVQDYYGVLRLKCYFGF
ncbi:hypothetical protein BGI51_07630 [Pseudomonas oryzihabitans]|uniref:hypothetical protein n=1 Tax=Pseudomonas oryzihabitans TaxID=47885 RepID=UPI00165E7F8D|nr:hypothetical protein [Pseudomonas psychrotolerans]QNQ97570.1 hypothetical protein BGI51_07630 [Pseudomonas psychrotolerans]